MEGIPFPAAVLSNELSVRTRARQKNPRRKIFDWISEPRPEDLTPFQKFFLDVDWKSSPLGPIKTWPAQLRQMVLLVVQDPSPAVILWGDGSTIIYNEAHIPLIGQKHPALQGQDPKIGFAEIWDHFEKLLANQRETAEATVEANAFLLLHRFGFFEETYFSWKFCPIIGNEGWVVGSHATVIEVTREVLSERRYGIIRELSAQLSGSISIKDLWRRLLLGIHGAETDVPLALLYSTPNSPNLATELSKSPSRIGSVSVSTICALEGTIGVPDGHSLAPGIVHIETDNTCLSTAFAKVLSSKEPLEFEMDESRRNEFDGIEWRGFGVPSKRFVAFPIIPTDSEEVLALFVLALNPRRPYDEDYRNFFKLLVQQATTAQLSAVILREEVENRQQIAKAEAMDRDRLSKELTESETKFARFATRAPLGLAILTPDGQALTANPLWRELTKLEVGCAQVEWGDVLVEGEMPVVNEAWARVLEKKEPEVIQTMIRRPWKVPELDIDGKEQWDNTHLLLAMYPDFDENGEVSTIMSCVTDISGMKWTESQLRRKVDQATEIKKQQERFIDMTSHEMRNPLSALIGCADEIISSLNELRLSYLDSSSSLHTSPNASTLSLPTISTTSRYEIPQNAPRLLDEAIEAADTIIYCAMHQKRIIDDILTLSRLDSNLLLVSPEPCQPVLLIRSALKMFEAELKRATTTLEFIESPSLTSLSVSWTLLDPSRVLQVLINLMTNAIKFTRTEPKRKIQITMFASLVPPSQENPFDVKFVQKSHPSPSTDETSKAEWGDGEIIYLSITVSDSGRGLTEEEMKKLFNLFAQANPKTHQTYGGSGLGLFICRQLVEMQGGEIGVRSSPRVGSTFSFYVKTRRTTPPKEAEKTAATNLQLLVREDALREACAVEITIPFTQQRNGDKFQQQARRTSLAVSSTGKEVGNGLSILVVEDNLVNQKVITKQLRKVGHTVHVANHGEEALALLQRTEHWASSTSFQADGGAVVGGKGVETETARERLDVVLMDLEMPVMDGISCVKRIREMQGDGRIKTHIPVIAVTANARKHQIMRCLEAGMDDVTTKPYRITELLGQIERLVGLGPPANTPMPLGEEDS